MTIKLEGVNKQLVHEYLVEKFRAERSEFHNHWPAQQKHAKRAATKIVHDHLIELDSKEFKNFIKKIEEERNE